jgi:hypothetical protein
MKILKCMICTKGIFTQKVSIQHIGALENPQGRDALNLIPIMVCDCGAFYTMEELFIQNQKDAKKIINGN